MTIYDEDDWRRGFQAGLEEAVKVLQEEINRLSAKTNVKWTKGRIKEHQKTIAAIRGKQLKLAVLE